MPQAQLKKQEMAQTESLLCFSLLNDNVDSRRNGNIKRTGS